MTVRAKFTLDSFETTLHSRYPRGADGSIDYTGQPEVQEMRTLKFSPVSGGEAGSENARFWDASPHGQLLLGTVNPEAWSQFELGRAYYLDFTPAD